MPQSGRLRETHFRDNIVPNHQIITLYEYRNSQRVRRHHGIMLGRILYQQLHGARKHHPRRILLIHIGFHRESLRKPDLQQLHIRVHECQFLIQHNQLLFLALYKISIYTGQFSRVQAGLRVLLLANQAVQNVQRIEQEVRIQLPFELEVAVLGQDGSPAKFRV